MPTPLAVINLARQAKRLEKPYQLLTLEHVDDLAVYITLCQRAVAWHRHVDEDELFIVYRGLVTLESEWGTVTLRPWEMALIPKGVGHRSLAAWPSVLLLTRPAALQDRKNGNRRMYALPVEGRLRKISLARSREWPGMPFRPQFLMHVEGFALRMVRCIGQGPWIQPRSGDTLLLVQEGTLLLESEGQQVPLMSGEVVKVPKHRSHRLTADMVTVVLELVRDRPERTVTAVTKQ
jgi:mannose-6-phosphate isomerase-like protein (cupin superfamily)